MITNAKTIAGIIVFGCVVYSCGSTQHVNNNNVLSKTNRQPQGSNQTVFVKPESQSRDVKREKDSQPKRVIADRPDMIIDHKPSNPNINPDTLTPGSVPFYAYKTDSVQTASAINGYKLNIDSIINLITVIPSQTVNPAVNSDQFYATPNFSIRKPGFVIIHHTGQLSKEQTLYTFSVKHSGVSAHYVIGKDGTVFQMLNDYLKAWHAGSGKWGNVIDMNSCSLGIELDNNGKDEPFPDNQIAALIKLLTILKKKYDIPTANFIGHADFAVGRKDDPSKFFPWKKLADAGFGYWYDADHLKTPPDDFNALMALRIIGYDTRNQEDAISAFKLHFIQNDVTPVLTDYDKKVLYTVYLRW